MPSIFKNNQNLTNFSVIIDNTGLIYTLNHINDLEYIHPPTSTLFVDQRIDIAYIVSDKYFVLTIVFASLIFVVVASIITLGILYKKKSTAYHNFLKHKERKMKGDYKKYEFNEEGQNNNSVVEEEEDETAPRGSELAFSY